MSNDSSNGASPAAERHAGLHGSQTVEHNRILRALPPEDYDWLLPQLTPIRLRLRQVLVEPDVPIREVYFIREGVASMIATEQDGGDIEVGTIGCEGFVGLPVLLDAESMSNRVIVQVEGEAWRISADACRRALDEHTATRQLCLRYAAYFTGQLSQAVACNRLHNLEERCARWLLMTHDRVPGEAFDLTHEFLSLMLGVRRAGVSVAMGILQKAGLVQYTRGRVTILDRPGLEDASFTCYQITRRALERLLG